MADKSKSKTPARAKAKAPKAAAAKTAKAAEPAAAPKKAAKAPQAASGKTAAAKAGKPAGAKQPKPAAPSGETYYVFTEVLPIEIRDTPPGGETRFVEFQSFDEAREHFLEHLIELIEHHERLLHAVRRAATFSDYLEQHGQFRAP